MIFPGYFARQNDIHMTNITGFHSTIVNLLQINEHLALEGAVIPYSSNVWERGRDKSLGEGMSGSWRPHSQRRILNTAKYLADYCFIIFMQTRCAEHYLRIPWKSTSQLWMNPKIWQEFLQRVFYPKLLRKCVQTIQHIHFGCIPTFLIRRHTDLFIWKCMLLMNLWILVNINSLLITDDKSLPQDV